MVQGETWDAGTWILFLNVILELSALIQKIV